MQTSRALQEADRPKTTKTKAVTVNFEIDALTRLDRIAQEVRRLEGRNVSRSEIVRAVVSMGLGGSPTDAALGEILSKLNN